MRYIAVDNPGPEARLSVQQMEPPQPGFGQLLIRVAYAGINRPDVFQRRGAYPPPQGASPILGLEASGTVVAVGEGCRRFKIGDQLCALTNGGAYAELVAVDETQCLPIPLGFDLKQAAALPETCFTVWSNVYVRGQLKPEETLLVHGGASGIGTTAIQMAKALGSRVLATVSTEDKRQCCLGLGADDVINYNEQDFVTGVRALSDGNGVDVVLDMVGGDYINKNIAVCNVDGRIVSIAFLRGAKCEVNFTPMMTKRLTLTGSTLRPQSKQQKAVIAEELERLIWPLMGEGRIRPVIAGEYSMTEADNAHQLMMSNALIGKLVINMELAESTSYEN